MESKILKKNQKIISFRETIKITKRNNLQQDWSMFIFDFVQKFTKVRKYVFVL